MLTPGKILFANMAGTTANSGFHSWSREQLFLYPGYGIMFTSFAWIQGAATLSYEVASPITTFRGTQRLAPTMVINSRGVYCR